ncbi:hypothetical protein NL676_012030 [Syzygium grande]|nr:hypothetical protein NL676_012030 [Syzygium grande]
MSLGLGAMRAKRRSWRQEAQMPTPLLRLPGCFLYFIYSLGANRRRCCVGFGYLIAYLLLEQEWGSN